MPTVDCTGKTSREINREIRALVHAGETHVHVRHPQARHNLGVALLQPVTLTIMGSVGYYCGGLMDGATIEVEGSCGWGVAESMLAGTVVVGRNAGNSAGASMRGGTVVVRGNASSRAGIAMKGGTLIVQGDSGYMTGFMMQKGTIVVCGDAAEALGDSMYEGRIFVGGRIADLGNDAEVGAPTEDDRAFLAASLARHAVRPPAAFRKVVAGRRLWQFDKKDFETWREAL